MEVMMENKKWFKFYSNHVRRKYGANTTETPSEESGKIDTRLARKIKMRNRFLALVGHLNCPIKSDFIIRNYS